MIFGQRTFLNLGTTFYPQAILLKRNTHDHLGIRFRNKDSSIFVDIPINELQNLFKSKFTNANDLMQDAHKNIFNISQFFPVGLPFQFCNIDMSIVKDIKIEYLNENLTPENPGEFISFIYPCCVVRLKRKGINSCFVEHLYTINRTIYNTDFIERFKVEGPISIFSLSNPKIVSAVCSTRYFDMNIEDEKSMEDFDRDLKEFRDKYAIPYGLDINMVSQHGKTKITIIPKRGDLKLGALVCKTSSITLTPDAIVEYSPSLSVDIHNYNNNPTMYILPNFNKEIITANPKRPPTTLDYKAVTKIAELGYMNTRYILTGENEFTILPECRIDPFKNVFRDIYAKLETMLEKEDIGKIIEDMKSGKIEISRRVSIEKRGAVFIFQVKIPVDYGAFGEKNKEEAYRILKNRFIKLKKSMCDSGSCKKAEDEFCFEFKIFKEKEPAYTI